MTFDEAVCSDGGTWRKAFLLAGGILAVATGIAGCGKDEDISVHLQSLNATLHKVDAELVRQREAIESLSTSVKSNDSDGQRSASLDKISSELARLRDEIEALSKSSKSSDSRSQKATGTEDAAAALAVLEQTIAEESSWPSRPEAADEFYLKLRNVLERASPAEQEFLLSRLVSVRFAAEVFKVLVETAPTSLEGWELRLHTLTDLLEFAPENTSPVVLAGLEAEESAAREQAARLFRENAIAKAKAALQSEQIEPATAAWQQLDGLETANDDPDVVSLRKSLKSLLISAEVATQCKRAETDLQRLVAEKDPVLRRVGLSRLYEQVTALRLDLLLSDEAPQPETLKPLTELAGRLEQQLRDVARTEAEADAQLRRQ